MTKEEFCQFCHDLFINRGFRKKGKNRYYLNGDKRILCCIELQKSICEGYYLNYHYFIGSFRFVKDFPSPYAPHFAVYSRIVVPQKDPSMAKHDPKTVLIEYGFYTEEDLLFPLNQWLDKLVIPVEQGKQYLSEHLEEYSKIEFYNEWFFKLLQQDDEAEREEKEKLQD